MIEMKIWVNKVKETTKTLEYKNSGNINIDIKYISNLSSIKKLMIIFIAQ